jgi:hypothetical protein
MSSTFLCLLGLGESFEEKFVKIKASLIPHTNTHPVIWKSTPKRIKNEIRKSEKIWTKEFKLPIPLSHVFSYHSPYGLGTKYGTKEAVAFSASDYLQWIREWPIPNAPADFFLPTKLYWGISAGGDLENKKICDNIKSEFSELYKNGADYMQVSGHLPDGIKKGPDYLKKMFGQISKAKDVWIAGADEIIRYYKCRENIFLGRIYEEDGFFIVPLIKKVPFYFDTEITMVQKAKCKLKIEQSFDGKVWERVNFGNLDKKQGLIMYPINSKSKFLRYKKC